jgi:hemerythrin
MDFMTWTEAMSVGVQSLDEDHKKLFAIVNDLHDGIRAGHRKDILEDVVDQLVDYTKFHFAREEHFLKQNSFASFEMHKSEHDGMIKKIINVQLRLRDASVVMLDLELMGFLQSWLINHIQRSDKKYQACLNSNGIF